MDNKAMFSLTYGLFVLTARDGETLSAVPSATCAYYHASIKPKPQPKITEKTVWRCRICGYEYEGDELPADFVCPLCKHGASDFEKVTAASTEAADRKQNTVT